MIHACLQNDFLPQSTGTIIKLYLVKTLIDNKEYSLNIIESGGKEGTENLRSFVYPYADVCVICYDVKNFESFNSIKKKVRTYCCFNRNL